MDVNNFIPSFADFVIWCKESDVEQELMTEILFEFLNNPKIYNKEEKIRSYLSSILPIDNYIQLTSRLFNVL